MPKEDHYIIWPAYLDSTLSRGKGRKIPKSKAVSKPNVEEIVSVARKLDLNPSVENKKYPKLWYEQTSRVVVSKKYNKRETLIKISEEIMKMRQKTK